MSTTATDLEDLEREAADVRARLRTKMEDLERISQERLARASSAPISIETAASSANDTVQTPERRQLERRADRVRERLIDDVEALEKKARERILPIVVIGGAAVLLYTVGFAWMFYKTLKLSRR